MKIARLVIGLAGLGLALACLPGCSLFTPGASTPFVAGPVMYQATGGLQIIAVDNQNQISYRVTCPVCGTVSPLAQVAAPAVGAPWRQEFKCSNCFYRGEISVGVVAK